MKQRFSLAILIGLAYSISAQSLRYTGCMVDSTVYYSVPRVKEQVSRSYQPSAFSLLKYCPKVKDQRDYQTCVAWATAYAARTMVEAIRNGWTDNIQITREAFSPCFVYAIIKPADAEYCDKGTYIKSALQTLQTFGAPKYKSLNKSCYYAIEQKYFDEAKGNKLHHYNRLFDYQYVNTKNEKISAVKKSISEKRPVVISMWVPKSFHENASESWISKSTDSRPNKAENQWHAMCIVAYNDSNFNGHGGFLLMNSWGDDWGDNGFTWISYDDFFIYTREAYEVYMDPIPILPDPFIQKNDVSQNIKHELFGLLELQHYSGEMMESKKHVKDGIICYRINERYTPGMRFRIFLSNYRPAYVYVISSDMLNNVEAVFPPDKLTSAALTYKTNHIAIPDETHCIQIREEVLPVTNYLCVFYSTEELDFEKLCISIKNTKGSIYKKIRSVIGEIMVAQTDVNTYDNEIRFEATSEKTILPLVIEIQAE